LGGGIFLLFANLNEEQKEKIGVWNRQRGLRLWSKTNLTYGKGDVLQIPFGAAYHIPCRILWFR